VLQRVEFYAGIVISIVLTIIYLVGRRPVFLSFFWKAPDALSGIKRFRYLEALVTVGITVFLMILETLIWNLNYLSFIGVFLLVHGIYFIAVLVSYLRFRGRNKDYIPGQNFILW